MIYIYGLYDPRVKPRVWRYVGKTTQNPERRLAMHLNYAMTKPTSHKHKWFNLLLRKGIKPEIHLLEIMPDEGNWEEAERRWIRRLRNAGHSLTNVDEGGRGRSKGHPVSAETREKIRKANKGKPGHAFSAETRRKIGAKSKAALTGCKQSPEHVRKRAEKVRGHTVGPKAREKIGENTRAALTGRRLPLEHRRNISRGQRGRRLTEDWKRHVGEGVRRAAHLRRERDEGPGVS